MPVTFRAGTQAPLHREGEKPTAAQGPIASSCELQLCTGTYLPATHGMQSDDSSLPVVSTYVPATQSMQLSWDELATMNENLPARHAMQWPLPATSVYLPAEQSTQSFVDELKNLP